MRVPRTDAPPLRRFGQNFLASPPLALWLVESFGIRAGDRVVEIGPGRGALTRHLAGRAARFLALEIDDRLHDGLRLLLADHPHHEVIAADAVTTDWTDVARLLGGPVRVIGNLPYNVGTAIVRAVIASPAVEDAQFVLQKEVVDRLVASPGTKAFGPLTVLAALRGSSRRLRTIAPGAFSPRPKVTSAVWRWEARADAPLPADDVDWLERWLHRGFAQRRKTLAGNLHEARDAVRAWLAGRGYPEDLRAEALPAEDWLHLARALSRPGNDEDQPT